MRKRCCTNLIRMEASNVSSVGARSASSIIQPCMAFNGASSQAYSRICHRLRIGMPYSVNWEEVLEVLEIDIAIRCDFENGVQQNYAKSFFSASFARLGLSNQYSFKSGTISVRTTLRYQFLSKPPKLSPFGRKKLWPSS